MFSAINWNPRFRNAEEIISGKLSCLENDRGSVVDSSSLTSFRDVSLFAIQI